MMNRPEKYLCLSFLVAIISLLAPLFCCISDVGAAALPLSQYHAERRQWRRGRG